MCPSLFLGLSLAVVRRGVDSCLGVRGSAQLSRSETADTPAAVAPIPSDPLSFNAMLEVHSGLFAKAFHGATHQG